VVGAQLLMTSLLAVVGFGPMTGGKGLRILVVEDRPDCAQAQAWLLCVHGHQVWVAGDGCTALSAVAANQPDAVLLDLGLPDMDGWEVAKRIKAQVGRKRPLLIAVTGYGQETDRRRSEEVGIELHLVKPVDPIELEGILRRFQKTLDDS
jgi:CheY-like chemotaxis protein